MAELGGGLTFLGAGRMATALAGGIVNAGRVAAERITASDPDSAARERFAERVAGARAVDDNAAAVEDAATVVLAVKPQLMDAVLQGVRGALPTDALVVSIAAGVPLARLAASLPTGARLVRVMPNTPCLIGQGASAFAVGEHATGDDAQQVADLFGSVGYAAQVDERMLDAVTGLSGSGPAFVYTAVEALADAGVRSGLPRDVALELAARTTAGAAQMITTTGEHPAALRDAVTSPGGTTAAGLAELEHHGLSLALHAAVAAATRRARELGQDQ